MGHRGARNGCDGTVSAKTLASGTVLARAWTLKLEHSTNEDENIPLLTCPL